MQTKTIAHHQKMMTSQSPSNTSPANLPPSFIVKHNAICYGVSLWLFGLICPGSIPS